MSETRTGDQQCLKATETIDVVFQGGESVALSVEKTQKALIDVNTLQLRLKVLSVGYCLLLLFPRGRAYSAVEWMHDSRRGQPFGREVTPAGQAAPRPIGGGESLRQRNRRSIRASAASRRLSSRSLRPLLAPDSGSCTSPVTAFMKAMLCENCATI